MNLLLVFSIVGLVLLIGGRLPISRHRQVKGMIARVIGALLLIGTLLFFGLIHFGPYLFSQFDIDDETARTWSFIAATVAHGSILIYIALNLKRWSTIDHSTIETKDFKAVEEQDTGGVSFDFLESSATDRSHKDADIHDDSSSD